ncbi:MAG: hypothetical protein ACMUIP_07530 [bacterium]
MIKLICSNGLYFKGIILCVIAFLIILSSKKSYCARLKMGLEFNSEKSASREGAEKQDTSEYRPKLFINYQNQVAQTELLGNLKIDYRKEKNSVTRERMDRSFDMGLRSEIYQLNTGLNETREEQNKFEPLIINKHTFGEGIFQPKNFPADFRFKLSQRENQDKTNRKEVEVRYKMFSSLEFMGNYNEVEYDDPNNNEQRIIGRVRARHSFFSKRTLKLDAAYKAESLYREDIKDEIIHTIQAKASYKPVSKTQVNFKYETEILDNQKDPNTNNTDYKIDFDINQKLWDWAHIKYERSWDKEETDTLGGDTTKKDIWLVETTIDPTQWLDLNLKWIDEEESFDPNTHNNGKYITEQSLRSHFDTLFKSQQTINHRTIIENMHSKEEYIKWNWRSEPIKNLDIVPGYEYSIIKKYDTLSKDRTHEYSMDLDYRINLLDKTDIEFSHSWDQKKTKADYDDPNRDEEFKEYNTTFKLDISTQPFEKLYLNTGLNMEKRDERTSYTYINTKDITYFIKFDWDLNLWNLSSSYQYDKRDTDYDTESFQSKLGYRFKNYSIEVKYKYNYTFSTPSKYEHTLFFKFKTNF